mmetsp:Transcript_8004/g.25686  ORF Transcript_8004/g.25686 Transcript_8004/m.25686 type:complete len:222 (+) Transcript_8004:1405-2070(+)
MEKVAQMRQIGKGGSLPAAREKQAQPHAREACVLRVADRARLASRQGELQRAVVRSIAPSELPPRQSRIWLGGVRQKPRNVRSGESRREVKRRPPLVDGGRCLAGGVCRLAQLERLLPHPHNGGRRQSLPLCHRLDPSHARVAEVCRRRRRQRRVERLQRGAERGRVRRAPLWLRGASVEWQRCQRHGHGRTLAERVAQARLDGSLYRRARLHLATRTQTA